MNRLRIARLLFLTAILMSGVEARAQLSLPLVAWGVTVDSSPAQDGMPAGHEALITLDVSLRDWLPQTSPDSRLRLAAIGARWIPDAEAGQSRPRLTLMDVQLQRAFWSGSVNLLDLNRSGLLARQDVWLEAGTGPGFHADRGLWALSGQFQVFGGGSRVDTGFPGTEDERPSAWYCGARSSLSARFTERLLLVVSGQYASYTGVLPSWWTGAVRLEIRPSRRLTLGATRERLAPARGKSDGFRDERTRTVLFASVRLN